MTEPAASASKKKVMIVDDAPLMRLVIRNMVDANPKLSVVAVAENGKVALDKLGEHQPDLILLDIEMPVMDGLEFLRYARLKSKAKVVILSSVAAAGSEKAAKARALGADAVVTKPSGAVSLDLEEKRGSTLIQIIYELLGIPAE